jgi:hypothetical protein
MLIHAGLDACAEEVWTPVLLTEATPTQLGDIRTPTMRKSKGVSPTGLVAPLVRGLRIPLGKQHALLLDLDRDDVFGSAGDGYVAPQSATAGPWCGEAWHAHGGLRIRGTSASGFESTPLLLPRPQDKDHCQAWCLLQWRRQQCGVLPVTYDLALEAAMVKHASYLARNGETTHSEDAARPGYSPEGAQAGENCILGFGDRSAYSALEMELATLYHRTRPLQPGLTHTAIVFHQGIFLLNVFQRRGGPLKDAVLVYPPHGMEDVPLRFHAHGENPMPVADVRRDAHTLGTAISLFSEPLRLAPSLPEVPILDVHRQRRGSRRTPKPLTTHFHYPGLPPGADVGASNRGCIARIPTQPLKPKSRYVATVNLVLPDGSRFAYAWGFRTRNQ